VLLDAQRGAGPQEVTVDTKGLSAGVYLARLRAGREEAVGKILVVP